MRARARGAIVAAHNTGNPPQGAVAQLLELGESRDADLARQGRHLAIYAAWCLTEAGRSEEAAPAIAVIEAHLEDPDATVSGQAWAALEGLGAHGNAAAPAVLARLVRKEQEQKMLEILAALGPCAGAAPVIAPYVTDGSPLALPALRALAAQGAAAEEALIAATRSEQQDIACEAAAALGRIGTSSAAAREALLTCLGREAGQLSELAIEALGNVGGAETRVVADTMERLDSLSELERERRLAGLQKMGIREVSSLNAIRQAYVATTRVHGLQTALARIVRASRPALAPELSEILLEEKDGYPLALRESAGHALAGMDAAEPGLVPKLLEALDSEDLVVEGIVLGFLTGCSADGEEVLAALLRELREKRAGGRVFWFHEERGRHSAQNHLDCAAFGLARRGAKGVAILAEETSSEDIGIASAAVRALSRLEPDLAAEGVDILVKALSHPSQVVCSAALSGLGNYRAGPYLGSGLLDSAVPALKRVAKKGETINVRRSAESLLKFLERDARR